MATYRLKSQECKTLLVLLVLLVFVLLLLHLLPLLLLLLFSSCLSAVWLLLHLSLSCAFCFNLWHFPPSSSVIHCIIIVLGLPGVSHSLNLPSKIVLVNEWLSNRLLITKRFRWEREGRLKQRDWEQMTLYWASMEDRPTASETWTWLGSFSSHGRCFVWRLSALHISSLPYSKLNNI